MAIQILKREITGYSEQDGKSEIVAELFADTTADLPQLDEVIDGGHIKAASICYVCGGQFYTLDSSGTWKGQDGTEVEA